MCEHAVTSLLHKWPDRRAVWVDAVVVEPELDLVAVHRWFQRGSVPSRFWPALLQGARGRGLEVTADDIVMAHARTGDAA